MTISVYYFLYRINNAINVWNNDDTVEEMNIDHSGRDIIN